MDTYITVEPILHNGTRTEPESDIDLDAKAAKALLASGAIKKKAESKISPEEKHAAIKAAIEKLNLDNKELWQKDGKPTVAAIKTILGYSINNKERDAAWLELNPKTESAKAK